MSDVGDVDLGVEVSKGVAAKFIQAVVGFAGTILFARILGPVEFGAFYLLLAIVDVVDKPVVGGWATASKKRFAEVGFAREAIVGSQILFNSVMIVAVGLLAYLFRTRLADFTGLDTPVVLLLALFVPVIFFHPFQSMVVARGMVGRQVGIDTFRSLVTFPLQLLFVLLGFGAAGMAFGLGGATLVCLPLTYYSLRTRPAFPSWNDVRSLWAFARHCIPNSMVSKVFDRYDILLLGLLLGPAAAGQYEVAIKLTVPAMFVATIAGSALMPKVSNLRSKGEPVTQDVTNTLAFTSLFSIPIFFGALAIPRQLVVTAYGPAYREAALLLVGLALFRVLETQSAPLRQAINGIDRPDLNFKISSFTLAFNIVTGYVLVLEMGAIGVVIATVAAEALRYGFLGYSVKRELPTIDLFPRPIVMQAVAGLVMFGVVVGVSELVSVRTWLHLFLIVGIGATTYSIILLSVSRQVRAMTTRVLLATFETVGRYGDRFSGH